MTHSNTNLHEDRMRRFREAGLYLVTSQALSAGRTTPAIVEAALAGGVRLIQLREKELALPDFVALAKTVRTMTAAVATLRSGDPSSVAVSLRRVEAPSLRSTRQALLIVNDRLDVALAVDADGVHLGQNDLPVDAARRMAPDLIIGASTHSVEEALRAQELGASYVNIGPLFPTQTKSWAGEFLGLEGLRRISAAISIPFTVMGGIKKDHIPDLVRAGARTIALVTAVTAAADPAQAARELLALIRGTSRNG